MVNGTANSIVAGAATASSSNASSLTQGIFSQGTISITVSGGSQTINVAGFNQIIGPRTGADRTRVTPAEALALYQVSLAGSGAAQTIGISSTRQVSSVNPQTGLSPSTITVPGFDLPVSFSSFVLSATGNSAAVNLNVTSGNGGHCAIVFNASGRKVTLDGATFKVSAFKPVGFVEKISGPQGGVQATACDGGSIGPDSEPIDDAERGVNSAAAQPQMQDVAYLFVAGESSPHLLQFCKTETKQQPAIEFQSGEMYVHPTQSLSIDCGVGCVRVAKGAFVCISRTNSYLRVAVCSGPDEVSLVLPSGNDSSLRSRSIRLNPGEEIVVRERELAHGERQKLDGIGRRRFSKYAIPSQTTGGVTATLCEFSIVSALGSVPHLRCVSQGSGKVEQRLREKLLKTASVPGALPTFRALQMPQRPGGSSPNQSIEWFGKVANSVI